MYGVGLGRFYEMGFRNLCGRKRWRVFRQSIYQEMRTIKVLIFSIAVVLLGCSTPERLIERAIKKDPTIKTHTTDTIREFKTVVDSFAVIINDSIVYEKIVREIEVITVTNNNGIEIERKKTRLEIRKSTQLEKLIVRKDAEIRELELKNDRIQGKLDAKTDQKANKEQGKTDRTTTRQENKKSRWFVWFLFGAGTTIILRLLLSKYNIIGRIKKLF